MLQDLKTLKDCKNAAAIFKETHHKSLSNFIPVFNMTDEDDADSLSLKKLYMKHYKDPTEVSFIDTVLYGNFDLWSRVKENSYTKKFVKTLQTEAESRRLRDNLVQIAEIAADESNKARFSALKYLCDNCFKNTTPDSKRGRPSKAELEGAMKQELAENSEFKEALERLKVCNV